MLFMEKRRKKKKRWNFLKGVELLGIGSRMVIRKVHQCPLKSKRQKERIDFKRFENPRFLKYDSC